MQIVAVVKVLSLSQDEPQHMRGHAGSRREQRADDLEGRLRSGAYNRAKPTLCLPFIYCIIIKKFGGVVMMTCLNLMWQ